MKNLGEYIGLEFEAFGRGPRYDCWGLVMLFYAENFAIELTEYAKSYDSTTDRLGIDSAMHKEQSKWINVPQPLVGDCIVFNIGGLASHIAIAIEKGHMLHIQKGKNSCIEKYDSKKWRNRIEGFYRHNSRQSADTSA